MDRAIWFDMDGVLANLYGVDNWLDYLLASDPYPYEQAEPLINMNSLARILNRLQREGWYIGIVSWMSKNSTLDYETIVEKAKRDWLSRHLHSVHWNEINIVPYGTPKQTVVSITGGILFDDEAPNRERWQGKAYDETKIFEVLKSL